MLNHPPVDEESLHPKLLGDHCPGDGGHHRLLLLVVGGDGAAAGDPPEVVHCPDDGAGVGVAHVLEEAVDAVGGALLEALLDGHRLVVEGVVETQVLLQPLNLDCRDFGKSLNFVFTVVTILELGQKVTSSRS